MKLLWLLASILILVPMPANADYSVSNGNNRLTLTDKPCQLGGWFTGWKIARMIYEGKPYEACWRIQGETVVVVDSNGDMSNVPARAFKKDVEV
jgi:hypothetical protein